MLASIQLKILMIEGKILQTVSVVTTGKRALCSVVTMKWDVNMNSQPLNKTEKIRNGNVVAVTRSSSIGVSNNISEMDIRENLSNIFQYIHDEFKAYANYSQSQLNCLGGNVAKYAIKIY